jgi:hypothetical protein
MFSLAINFGASGNAWSFLFTKKEHVEAAMAMLRSIDGCETIQITDDFGTTSQLKCNLINGWLVEDLNLAKGANVARSMYQAKTQAEFQSMAQNEPSLAILRGQQSPIIAPFPRQGRAS